MGFDDLPQARKLELLQQVADAALPRYAGLQDGTARLINVSENATYRVDAGDGRRVALRVHRDGYHTRNAIASELAWVQALRADAAVAAPMPLAGRDGEWIQDVTLDGVGRRHVVAFAWEQGHEPPETELSGPFEILGRTTAEMHKHARAWRRPAGFERLTWDCDGAFGPKPHWGRWQDGLELTPERIALFSRALALMQQRLARYGKGPERFGLVHCDMRLANLLLDGPHVKVIDFDDCGFGWFMYDCAAALSFMEARPDIDDLIAAWLRGYRQASPLSAEDEAEIPSFLMFRRLLILAWIGSHADTDLAKQLGPDYTANTVPLAEAYLMRFG